MGKRFGLRAGTVLVAGLVVSLAVSEMVGAISAYGAGTLDNPYRIATCSQLQAINDNLSGYYVLVSNVDCSGVVFTHLADSTAFTGTLDGQNHTIAHLSIDDDGLFNQTDGATIRNLSIASGSVSGGYVASFAQTATDTTFTNIHSAMDITNTAGYTGGLVGELHGNASISQSSFTGTLSTTGYVGGLVGAMWDAGTAITDSFSSGTLSSHSGYEGGIVGGFFNGTISRVYSSMTITLNGNPYNGGLVGDDQGTISNSFSAATIVGSNNHDGGLVGLDAGGTYVNDYFDKTSTNTANCFGLNGSGSCTGVNTGNAVPGYFKNNTTNAPLDVWNFSSVWQITSGYPALRNVSSFVDPTVPNNGDANGDGIADSYQANVASVKGSGDAWMTIVGSEASSCFVGDVQAIAYNSVPVDSGYTPLVDLAEFRLYCPSSGVSNTVTIIYDKQYDTGAAVLRRYNPSTKVYTTVSNATLGTVVIGGITKTTVTYTLVDGGILDDDGVPNGVTMDPVVIALLPIDPVTVTAPSTGSGRPVNVSWLESVLITAGAASLLSSFGVLYRGRTAKKRVV